MKKKYKQLQVRQNVSHVHGVRRRFLIQLFSFLNFRMLLRNVLSPFFIVKRSS